MEQERMITLTKAVTTLTRTCRALCCLMSAFTPRTPFISSQLPSEWTGRGAFALTWQGGKPQCSEPNGRAESHVVRPEQVHHPPPLPLSWLVLLFALLSRWNQTCLALVSVLSNFPLLSSFLHLEWKFQNPEICWREQSIVIPPAWDNYCVFASSNCFMPICLLLNFLKSILLNVCSEFHFILLYIILLLLLGV